MLDDLGWDVVRTRSQTLRRRRTFVFAGVVLAVVLALYLPLTLLSPIAPTAAVDVSHPDPVRTAAALGWPGYGESAIGAIGYPAVLGASGSTTPLPMASISKIITSLVVLQAKPLAIGAAGPTITITAADAKLVAKYIALDGETKPMTVGASISQLDMMRVALVASANNYADALADWAYGSQSAFVSAAQKWLTGNGLGQTTLVEPTGIDPRNVSTATDLVQLGKLALANPVIASIVSTQSVALPGVGSFDNTNTLLGQGGVDGIKTGTLNGQSNLLFSARYNYGGHSITVVGAVIGGANHDAVDASVSALLSSVQSGFHEVTLTTKGEPFATFSTPWNSDSRAVATKGATVLVWSDTPVTSVIDSHPVGVSADQTVVGRVTFTVGTQTVTVPLALDQAITDPGPIWRLGNPFTARS
jgi:D-alanyl-D-alanine carboxypeptidase (penicillin-binding protein 5/6)